ncbi:MAG: dihydrolipoyl dehydrogenase [Deltaproteobacteria bacterium]|nr:dihydrolipoyl dehydrogenase [Deltaproteobacteria bacterium]
MSSGGYVAAIRARQHGASVALVEKENLGGTCLNRGCIPSKALIAGARRLESVRKAAAMGIEGIPADGVRVNVAALMDRKNRVVTTLRGGVEQLMKGHGVEVVRGAGRLKAPDVVTVDGRELNAKAVIIATGSAWRSLPDIPVDGERIVASDHLLNWTEVPARLGIIGGGIIGCEFASMMQTFGAKVVMVEAAATLLPGEDPIVGRTLARLFTKRGMEIFTETTVGEVRRQGATVAMQLSNGQTREIDVLLVAVGRRPYTDELGIAELGIVNERGFVTADERMATPVGSVFAVGDVIGHSMLAHVASAQAEVAVQNALGGEAAMSYHAVPRPIYTDPEVCGVGATEGELQAKGVAYRTGRFSLAAVSKTLCDGESPDGSMTVYADPDGCLLGGHLISPHATDLAQSLCVAIQNRLTVKDMMTTIYSHPTYSELVKEAVEDVEGRAVHKVTVKRSA